MNLSQKKLWRILLFLVPMLILMFSWSAGKGYAASDSENTPTEYTYALRIKTGTNSGYGIGIIIFKYYDSTGALRTKYYYPTDENYLASLEAAEEKGTPSSVEALKKMGYEMLESTAVKAFSPNTTTTFLISFPERNIEKLESISFITDIGQATSGKAYAWDCQGVEFFRVNQLNGIVNDGYISSSYFIDFEGVKIAKSAVSSGGKGYKLSSTDGRDVALTFALKPNNVKNTYRLETVNEVCSAEEMVNVVVRIDLANVYGSGLESILTFRDEDMDVCLPELLALSLYYVDKAGTARQINVPVLACALCYAMDKGGLDPTKTGKKVASLVDQDGAIYLVLPIAGFDHLSEGSTNVGLTYDPDKAAALCGLKEISTAKDAHDAVIKTVNDVTDSLSISAISVYSDVNIKDVMKFSMKVNNSMLITKVGQDPDNNYQAPSYEGTWISPGSPERLLKLDKFEEGDTIKPVDGRQKYVVIIHTSDVAAAGTLDELSMSLGYQVTRNGSVKYTDEYKVRDLVQAYYGFYPGTKGDTVTDVGYELSVRPNGFIYALISIDNVVKFKSLTLSINGEDAWQCDQVYIYQVSAKAMEGRTTMWSSGSTLSNGAYSTDRYIYRPFDYNNTIAYKNALSNSSLKAEGFYAPSGTGSVEILSIKDVVIYLDKNENTKTLDFDSRETRKVVDDSDWRDSDLFSEMSYEDTRKDMGFTEKMVTYTVTVKVGTEEYISQVNGDAGSSNYFFFQLVFEKGNSAFVQANQQLAADGFIAGEEAVFQISTNYDYGELEQINIIPDDISSSSSPYDKLKIDWIKVSRSTTDNANIAWISTTDSSNAWVGIDYREDGEDSGGMEKESREISDIMRTYVITERVIDTEVLIAICTGSYEPEGSAQLEASSLTANLFVTKLDGTTTSMSLDLIDKFYEFQNRTVLKDSYGNKITDKNTMLQGGHYNYFTLKLSDVLSIDYIEIYAETKQASQVNWAISKINIERITANYGHKIDKVTGDVVLDCDTETVTESKEELVTDVVCAGYEASVYVLTFEEQENTVAEASTEAYLQNRTPASVNDYLNVVAYMVDNGTDYSTVDLNCSVTYSNNFDSYYRSAVDLKRGAINGQTVFYANGLGAKTMVGLTEVKLTAADKRTTAKLERMVVQRVRGGVVIETYYLGALDGSLTQTLYLQPSGTAYKKTGEEYQIVTLALGNETPTATLSAESSDVAVAIKYTLKTGSEIAEYQSPFIFLTDQGITSISANKLVQLKFKQTNVGSITGIVVSVTGKELYIKLDSASIGTYEEVAGSPANDNYRSNIEENMTCTGWYSVVAQEKIQSERRDFQTTTSRRGDYKAVVPMSIKIKTMDPITGRNNTGLPDGAIASLHIFYTGADGKSYVRTLEDIAQYCENYSSKSFTTGRTDVITFMEQNMSVITAVVVSVTDNAVTTATWGIESLTFSYGDGVDKTDFTIPVNEIVYEGKTVEDIEGYKGLMVGVKDVIITVDATTENGHTGGIDTITYTNGEGKEIPTIRISKLDGVVKFKVKLQNNIMGATIRAGRTTKVDATDYLTVDEGENEFTFAPPTSKLTEEVTYTIEVISKENPAAVSAFYVVVEKGLIQSNVSISADDIYQGEALPSFDLTMNKVAISEAEIEYEILYTVFDGVNAASKTVTETGKAVIAKDSDKVTVKCASTELPASFYGDATFTIKSVKGGGYDDLDFTKAKYTAKIRSVGAVSVSSKAATVAAGEDVVFTVTPDKLSESDMTVYVRLKFNGKQLESSDRELKFSSGQKEELEIRLQNMDSGTYTAEIVKIEGGFEKATIAAKTAECAVNAPELKIKDTLKVIYPEGTDHYGYGSKNNVNLSFRFDRTLTKDAIVKVKVVGVGGSFTTTVSPSEEGTDSGTITLKNLGLVDGTYTVYVQSITYYGVEMTIPDSQYATTFVIDSTTATTEAAEE